jgi:DNA-binding transcriptional regulator YiaG
MKRSALQWRVMRPPQRTSGATWSRTARILTILTRAGFRLSHAQAVRRKLGLSQSEFARLLVVPAATLRNWEQNRYSREPAVRALLRLIDHEPEAALRALRPPPERRRIRWQSVDPVMDVADAVGKWAG